MHFIQDANGARIQAGQSPNAFRDLEEEYDRLHPLG